MLTAIAAATGMTEAQVLALLLLVVAPAAGCVLTLAYDAVLGWVFGGPDSLEPETAWPGEVR